MDADCTHSQSRAPARALTHWHNSRHHASAASAAPSPPAPPSAASPSPELPSSPSMVASDSGGGTSGVSTTTFFCFVSVRCDPQKTAVYAL